MAAAKLSPCLAAVTVALALFGTPAITAAEAADASSTVSLASLPTGPADENELTSRGITAILDRCARAYLAVQAMHATGQYVAVNKSEDEPTSYAASRVRLDFKRPDQLAIHSQSESTD